jgi:hypothetical protein
VTISWGRPLLLSSLGSTLLPVSGLAVPDVDLRPYVAASIEAYNELAAEPLPQLGSEDIEELLAGEVIKIRRKGARAEDPDGDRHERVVGYILIDRPRDLVWLAALDPSFLATDLITELRLETDEQGTAIWYQYISLPWPITDRHWVVRLWKSIELATRTDQFIWEQNWDLADDGPQVAREIVGAHRLPELDLDKIEKAIYLPVNHGNWTLFALTEDTTLLAYRVSTVVGGSIPESWVASFAVAQLDRLLKGVARHADDVLQTWDPEKHPIYGGDGRRMRGIEGR